MQQQSAPKHKRVMILFRTCSARNPESTVLKKFLALDRSLSNIDETYGVGTEIKLLEKGLGSKISLFQFAQERATFPELEPKFIINDVNLWSLELDPLVLNGSWTVYSNEFTGLLWNQLLMRLLIFQFYKRKLKPTTKVMVNGKAICLGRKGRAEIANHLQDLGADYLGRSNLPMRE